MYSLPFYSHFIDTTDHCTLNEILFVMITTKKQLIDARGNAVLPKVKSDPGHPTDLFGGISVLETYDRLRYSAREMSSRTCKFENVREVCILSKRRKIKNLHEI